MSETDKPDLRARQAKRTLAALRAAALVLAKERGFDAMTIDDVASLAGVSRRTVFNYVSCKADLVVENLVILRPQVLEDFVNGTGPILTDLVTLIVRAARAAEDADPRGPQCRRAEIHLVLSLIQDSSELKRALHDRLRTFSEELEQAASRRLGLPATDLQVKAVGLLGAAIYRAALSQWVQDDTPVELSVSQAMGQAGAAFAQVFAHEALIDNARKEVML